MMLYNNSFPLNRPRRLRRTSWIRAMVQENILAPTDLILPLFICEGSNIQHPIASMPGVKRLSIDQAIQIAHKAADRGIPAIALFPTVDPKLKSNDCANAYDSNNLINRATRAIKAAVADIGIILDIALDPYNAQGHDGLVKDGVILNDKTLKVLGKQALEHAAAGADIIAPSDMMDGRIQHIRKTLEKNSFSDVAILAYSAKFSSAFYGPFRDAINASPLNGDKKTYQINPANSDEALRMIIRDLNEGADMVMIKPGMPYLDLCYRTATHTNVPIFAYQVSGEYAMIQAAAANGWLDYDTAIFESLIAFKRAGCCGILTYAALEVAANL